MGVLEGKVAFITGAARGQGRSHAVRLAEEGADIIAVDICEQMSTVAYDMSTPEDLAETVSLVEAKDRRIVARRADVRDFGQLKEAFDAGVAELGRVDIVLANAGIAPLSVTDDPSAQEEIWNDVIGVNLTGVWNTVRVAIPSLIEADRGGSIIITSSTAGLKGLGGGVSSAVAYTASKHGVVGIMRGLAVGLAAHSIRVNTVHPTGVNTPMIVNPIMEGFLAANENAGNALQNALPVPLIEAVDVSNAIVWLASDAARYVTGVTLPVDAGYTVR